MIFSKYLFTFFTLSLTLSLYGQISRSSDLFSSVDYDHDQIEIIKKRFSLPQHGIGYHNGLIDYKNHIIQKTHDELILDIDQLISQNELPGTCETLSWKDLREVGQGQNYRGWSARLKFKSPQETYFIDIPRMNSYDAPQGSILQVGPLIDQANLTGKDGYKLYAITRFTYLEGGKIIEKKLLNLESYHGKLVTLKLETFEAANTTLNFFTGLNVKATKSLDYTLRSSVYCTDTNFRLTP
jgi:hypothetical protein